MLEGKSILVVDDDLTLAEMYEICFKEAGAVVSVAHDGDEAIKLVEANKPSAILLDILMPKFNGLEVLKVLKENSETRDIPVVVLTVLLENDKYEKAKALGAEGYLIKSETMPIDVVAKISELLSKKDGITEGAQQD